MKKLLLFFTFIFIILSLVGCGKEEITLNLSYGERTGTYEGEMKDGVPHGKGKFTTENSEGVKWTYEGEFNNGHFEGEGKTSWETGQVEIGTYKDDVVVPINLSDEKLFFSSPDKYVNHVVEFVGKVFADPEYNEYGVAFQAYTDYENYDNDVMVYIYDESMKVNNDFVRIVGKVGEVLEGENMLGAKLTIPSIEAMEYEVLNYKDAVMPTLSTLDVNETKTQYGYSVTLEKVEFSEKETRVYVKVVNNGTDKFNLYSFNSVVVQDGKQYGTQDNWEADYPDIETDLLVGSTTEGIIAFPPIEEKNFKIVFDAYSQNYNEDIEPYVFELNM